jgi:hypothetical protein
VDKYINIQLENKQGIHPKKNKKFKKNKQGISRLQNFIKALLWIFI